MIATAIVVSVIDAGFFVCLLATWWKLRQRGLNRPGQVALGLLGAARLTEVIQRLPDGLLPASEWTWLLWTVFSFLFLYTLYQFGRLIAAMRRYKAQYRPRKQPLRLLQLASHPRLRRSRDL